MRADGTRLVVATSRVGGVDVALDASLVMHVMDDEAEGRALDLAEHLGRAHEGPRRGLIVRTAKGALRVRVGSEVRVAEQPVVLDAPSLVSELLARLGVIGLVPHDDGYALLVDVERAARR